MESVLLQTFGSVLHSVVVQNCLRGLKMLLKETYRTERTTLALDMDVSVLFADYKCDHSLGIHLLCWRWDSFAWHYGGRLPHNRFCFEICLHDSRQELAHVILLRN